MTPTIFSRNESGCLPSGSNGIDSYSFGPLGPIKAFTFHHTSGARATTNVITRELHKSIQAFHVSKGWGDIAYHYSMDDAGRIYKLRPTSAKGSHTGGHNTGNIGFVLHGNYEKDFLTQEQRRSLTWLFRGGFYTLFAVNEKNLTVRTHHEWDGPTNQTDCPGSHFQTMINTLRKTDL